MKAITIWPEWCFAIRYLGKDVENRTWRLPKQYDGERIALHAGARFGGNYKCDSEYCKYAFNDVIEMAKKANIHGYCFIGGIDQKINCVHFKAEKDMIINGCEFKQGYWIRSASFQEIVNGAIFATATVKDLWQGSVSPWAALGQYHWGLEDIKFLKYPVKCKGRQRLWNVSDEILFQ